MEQSGQGIKQTIGYRHDKTRLYFLDGIRYDAIGIMNEERMDGWTDGRTHTASNCHLTLWRSIEFDLLEMTTDNNIIVIKYIQTN